MLIKYTMGWYSQKEHLVYHVEEGLIKPISHPRDGISNLSWLGQKGKRVHIDQLHGMYQGLSHTCCSGQWFVIVQSLARILQSKIRGFYNEKMTRKSRPKPDSNPPPLYHCLLPTVLPTCDTKDGGIGQTDISWQQFGRPICYNTMNLQLGNSLIKVVWLKLPLISSLST